MTAPSGARLPRGNVTVLVRPAARACDGFMITVSGSTPSRSCSRSRRRRRRVLVGHQSPLWLAVLALETGGPGLAAALLRLAPPWLLRPRRPAPGSVTLLRFEGGVLAGPAALLAP